jgi:hypothetical protein
MEAQPAVSVGKPTLHQILLTLSKHREKLAARFHLQEIGVFGSYVRGQERAESDIDILVNFTITPGLFTLVELEDEITRLLGIPVDLAVKTALKPHIGQRILSEVIYI